MKAEDENDKYCRGCIHRVNMTDFCRKYYEILAVAQTERGLRYLRTEECISENKRKFTF
jgi:hypothetical protein